MLSRKRVSPFHTIIDSPLILFLSTKVFPLPLFYIHDYAIVLPSFCWLMNLSAAQFMHLSNTTLHWKSLLGYGVREKKRPQFKQLLCSYPSHWYYASLNIYMQLIQMCSEPLIFDGCQTPFHTALYYHYYVIYLHLGLHLPNTLNYNLPNPILV